MYFFPKWLTLNYFEDSGCSAIELFNIQQFMKFLCVLSKKFLTTKSVTMILLIFSNIFFHASFLW